MVPRTSCNLKTDYTVIPYEFTNRQTLQSADTQSDAGEYAALSTEIGQYLCIFIRKMQRGTHAVGKSWKCLWCSERACRREGIPQLFQSRDRLCFYVWLSIFQSFGHSLRRDLSWKIKHASMVLFRKRDFDGTGGARDHLAGTRVWGNQSRQSLEARSSRQASLPNGFRYYGDRAGPVQRA